MNIYLDIDGVILASDKEAARHVTKFLAYVTSNFDTYWLTTHCRGDASYTLKHLSQWLDEKTLNLASKIKPTNWKN